MQARQMLLPLGLLMLARMSSANQTIPAGDYFGGVWGPGEVITLEGSINVIGTVSAQAGVRVNVPVGASITVSAGGALITEGTAPQPVLFTSAAALPQPGDWQGISFAPNGGGVLDHAIVEYANIGIGILNDSPTITHCIIRRMRGTPGSAGANPGGEGGVGGISAGIMVTGQSTPIITDNIIEDVQGGAGGNGAAGATGTTGTAGTQGTTGSVGTTGETGLNCFGAGCTAGDGGPGGKGGTGGTGGFGTPGGQPGPAGPGGDSGLAVGIYFLNVTASGAVIERNVIRHINAGTAGAGGDGGIGGTGGKGGKGGTGGGGGVGGIGGAVALVSGTGGDGGRGGDGGDGGSGRNGSPGAGGGIGAVGGNSSGVVGFLVSGSTTTAAANLLIHDIYGSDPGLGGLPGKGGAGGAGGAVGSAGRPAQGGEGGSGGVAGTDGSKGPPGDNGEVGPAGVAGAAGADSVIGAPSGISFGCAGVLYIETRGSLTNLTVDSIVQGLVGESDGIFAKFASIPASPPAVLISNTFVGSVSGGGGGGGVTPRSYAANHLGDAGVSLCFRSMTAPLQSNVSGAVFPVAEPLFADAAGEDYHLVDGSLLIGLATLGAPALDFEGDARDDQPDIGADEYVVFDGRAFGDFDNDRCTGIEDFLFLLDNWNTVSPIGGEAIGINDFLNLLDNWGLGSAC